MPTDWVMGKIQRCPEITQARFIRLICLYWNKECVLTYEDAEIEIDKEHLDILIGKKIINLVDEFISIEFLNEQLESISETSKKRRDAVLLRWEKVKQNNTNELQSDTSVLQNDTDKSRVDKSKIREEVLNKKKEDFIKALQPFKNSYDADLLNEFYFYWAETKPNSKLLRWEREKAFDVERRLGTWVRRKDNYKQPTKSERL